MECSVSGCDKPARNRGWCVKHYARWKRHGHPLAVKISFTRGMTDDERFWYYVEKRSHYGCWLWRGTDTNKMGHGRMNLNGGGRIGAHQFAYEKFVGPVPDGLELDHLCKTPACVNPRHLEAVTRRENLIRGNSPVGINARRTHCINGHEFTPENTYTVPGGTARECRTCKRERKRVH